MMSEGEIRQLLETLRGNLQKPFTNTIQVAAFSGGVSALEMVLGEGK